MPTESELSYSTEVKSRMEGSLLGLAIGDALGASIEFSRPGSFEPITGFRSGGPFDLPAGTWTDDTSMALCLADSLIACTGFNPEDQLDRYLRWFKDGYLSCTGHCFDIGTTTRESLMYYHRTGAVLPGPFHERSAGNGSLMRLAPVPLFFHHIPKDALFYSGESSKTTHGHPAAVDACRFFAGLIVGALHGASKEDLLSPLYSMIPDFCDESFFCPEVAEVAKGSFLEKEPPEIKGTGYVVRSLEAALWAFAKGRDFRESVLLAVNLGDDTDTTGAICGQLAGAFYGISGISKEWREELVQRDVIQSKIRDLIHASEIWAALHDSIIS